jgi:hypothetical protein
MQDLEVLGVIERTPEGARVVYLREHVEADDATLAQSFPVSATEVYRLSGACESNRCMHFSDDRCRLAERIATMLPPVVDVLPPCTIRSNCRWFEQEGRAACLRCPQVVTECFDGSDEYRRVALPQPQDDT